LKELTERNQRLAESLEMFDKEKENNRSYKEALQFLEE
jgi:hypothetical protein